MIFLLWFGEFHSVARLYNRLLFIWEGLPYTRSFVTAVMQET